MNKPILKINNLKINFNLRDNSILRAVDGISYELYPNECLCIVGESGCGKSVSALSILNLIDSPGEIVGGEIFYKDKNILTVSDNELRKIRGKKISMIFQEPMSSLNPVFTVENQIDEMLKVHTDLKARERRKKIEEILLKVGINDAKNKMKCYPHQLSGGQCQRVMIAMNIICNPDILIADEPTTALDVTIQAQIVSLLKVLMNDNKMSVIFITHNLGIVSEVGDKIIIMYAGKIMESTSVENIFKNPQHPYTIGLLKCVPQLKTNKNEGLYVIPGTVENIKEEVNYCRFYNRCLKKTEKCLHGEPELVQTEKGHFVRCIHLT